MTVHFAYDRATDQADRAIGLIVLQNDETVDLDFRWLVPARDVRLYLSRVRSPTEVTLASLPTMREAIPEAVSLLPRSAGIGVIGYACTSASAVLGEDRVAEIVGAGWPEIFVTNPLSALIAACRALGIRRLGMVSPYLPDVSQRLIERLEAAGIAVPAFGSFGEKDEAVVARIAPTSVREAVLALPGAETCDAVFASCTNLRAAEVAGACEAELGKPVLCSNLVLAWHMMRLAGLEGAPLGSDGALSRAPLPA